MTDLVNIEEVSDDADSGYCANCGAYREVDIVVVNGRTFCDDDCAASFSSTAFRTVDEDEFDENPGFNPLR